MRERASRRNRVEEEDGELEFNVPFKNRPLIPPGFYEVAFVRANQFSFPIFGWDSIAENWLKVYIVCGAGR